MSHPATDDVVTAAIHLVPHIRAACEEGEATRRVPPALANAIAAAGLFQLHLPRTMGGQNSRHSPLFGSSKNSPRSTEPWDSVR
jgi:alkylation response protein AidB-like acyl-CoA dehydrogenase